MSPKAIWSCGKQLLWASLSVFHADKLIHQIQVLWLQTLIILPKASHVQNIRLNNGACLCLLSTDSWQTLKPLALLLASSQFLSTLWSPSCPSFSTIFLYLGHIWNHFWWNVSRGKNRILSPFITWVKPDTTECCFKNSFRFSNYTADFTFTFRVLQF